MKKKELLNYISNIKAELNEVSDFETSKKSLENLYFSLENQQILVPVIGNFSAGKSAFLNSFLEKDYLAVGITPETSLATELRYTDSEEKIEAINENEEIEKYTLDKIDTIVQNAKKYKYLKLYINSKELKSIEPIVLVDMPGFNSPVDLHNKAILEYLDKGIHYIFLISAVAGTISKTNLRELENIVTLKKDFSVGITKTDLRIENDLKEISNSMKELIKDDLDLDKNIHLLSIKDRESINNLINSINIEDIIEKRYLSQIKDLQENIIQNLELKIESIFMDNIAAEKNIRELKDSVEKIISKKEASIREAKEKYEYINTDSILNKVAAELNNSVNELTEVALSGNNDLFSSRISEIVRNSLINELEKTMSMLTSEVITDFGISLNLENKELFNEQVIDKIKMTASKYMERVKLKFDGFTEKSKTEIKGKGIYKAGMTLLSVTTSIIAPVMEVFLIFLPDILEGLFSYINRNKQLKEVRQKILYEIIPSVKVNVRPKLKEIIFEEVNKVIVGISESFEESLKEKQEILENTKKDRELKEIDRENEKKKYEEILNNIKNITIK